MTHKVLKTTSIFAVCFLLLTALAMGQTTSASLNGSVFDQSGGAVPGASVKAIDSRTNLSFQTVTGPEGNFVFPALQPGNYTVEVELAGFKKLVKTNIILNASDKGTTGVLTLEVGGVSETVSVSADLGVLQLKSSSG
jgi:hypothetical protein